MGPQINMFAPRLAHFSLAQPFGATRFAGIGDQKSMGRHMGNHGMYDHLMIFPNRSHVGTHVWIFLMIFPIMEIMGLIGAAHISRGSLESEYHLIRYP